MFGNWVVKRMVGMLALLFGLGYALWLGSVLAAATAHGRSAQNQPNGITSPTEGDVIAGVVFVSGTARHPEFLRYEISFFQEFNPDRGWVVFAEGTTQVVSGTLAVWDTTVGRTVNAPAFPDGLYRLRLRVVRQDYNYDEYFTNGLLVSNDDPTPTPTITPTTTLDPLLPTSVSLEQFQATPVVLPSLTPFPTPTPQATPATAAANPVPTPEPRQGMAEQLRQVDTSRFSAAAMLGVRLVMIAFAALAAYLLVRAFSRWLWRVAVGRWQNQRRD